MPEKLQIYLSYESLNPEKTMIWKVKSFINKDEPDTPRIDTDESLELEKAFRIEAGTQ